MPYEPQVPPVPSRKEELEMIDAIQKNFLSQGNFEINMAEADRLSKIKLAHNLREYSWNWWKNFLIGKIYLF